VYSVRHFGKLSAGSELVEGLRISFDGNCSIGAIVEKTLPSSQTKSQLDKARTFFEKLWWYDQVVFDASLCRARKEDT